MAKGYVGWWLPRDARARLLEVFVPSYPDVVADHVTLAWGVDRTHPLPKARDGRIVGTMDDGAGLQALVVEIDGTTRRPDGSVYHVTWSLDRARGRRPVESNDLLVSRGWLSVDPVPVLLEPRFFAR